MWYTPVVPAAQADHLKGSPGNIGRSLFQNRKKRERKRERKKIKVYVQPFTPSGISRGLLLQAASARHRTADYKSQHVSVIEFLHTTPPPWESVGSGGRGLGAVRPQAQPGECNTSSSLGYTKHRCHWLGEQLHPLAGGVCGSRCGQVGASRGT